MLTSVTFAAGPVRRMLACGAAALALGGSAGTTLLAGTGYPAAPGSALVTASLSPTGTTVNVAN